jgi:multidrug resistance protein MdtO
LSYFGLQAALAFYLINVQEFTAQTSLSIARDRVVGVFLGLFMMWLTFDQLWGASAVIEMKKVFVSSLRLLAQFAREPISKDLRVAIDRSYSLRETINKNFDSVRAFADSVLLEFGPSRQQDLAWRSRIVQWQPQLRTLFLLRIATWKYRAQLPSFELPAAVLLAQQEFDNRAADVLNSMADRMEGKASANPSGIKETLERLENVVQNCCSGQPQALASQLQTFLLLSRKTENLESSLSNLIERDA